MNLHALLKANAADNSYLRMISVEVKKIISSKPYTIFNDPVIPAIIFNEHCNRISHIVDPIQWDALEVNILNRLNNEHSPKIKNIYSVLSSSF